MLCTIFKKRIGLRGSLELSGIEKLMVGSRLTVELTRCFVCKSECSFHNKNKKIMSFFVLFVKSMILVGTLGK